MTTFKLSNDNTRVRLSLEQQVLLLRVVNHAANWHGYSEIFTSYPLTNDPQQHRRDGTTASALDRKGLLTWNRKAKTAVATLEGFWLGDSLRIEQRRRDRLKQVSSLDPGQGPPNGQENRRPPWKD